MMGEEYQVGDLVEIRQWDDMAEEYGVNDNGHIPCSATFTDKMRDEGLCGKQFVITRVDKSYGNRDKIRYGGHGYGYYISGAMIFKVQNDPLPEIDCSEIL